MFRNYFKTAFRNMRRNKLFTGLNIFGLATGLACSIIIFLWVQDEMSYDKFNPGAGRMFRLTAQVKDIETAAVPSAFAAAVKREIPAVSNTTRIIPAQLIVTIGTRKFDEKHIYFADSNFLRMFNYPLLRGNTGTVLATRNSVVLTEATAIKYFGSVEQAMDKSIYFDSSAMQVTGVLQNIPTNSHLQFDLLLPIKEWETQVQQPQPWRYFDSYTYLELAEAAKPGNATIRSLEKQLDLMRDKAIVNTPAVPARVSLQPLTDIHLYSHFRTDVDGQGNIQYVRIFMLVAIFIIFIACINFMNLATALSGTRAKEVGLRKTIGALRWQLTLQFIGESMMLSFIALAMAVLLVYASLPFFNTLASKSITLNLFDIRLTGKILAITAVVGLLAGTYPAFYMSSFNVIKVLKGNLILAGKGSFLRDGLVVLQFAVSVVLMVSTVIIYNQLRFIHNRDIGFNKEDLLYVPLPTIGNLKDNANALKSSLNHSSRLGDYTVITDLPTDLKAAAPLTWRGMDQGSLVMSQWMNVDENFIKTFDIKMLAGRFYSRDFSGSDSEFVVNETALKAMQLNPATAIGKMITIRGHEGSIIGVVKDFNVRPIHRPIEPLIIRHQVTGERQFLVVRTKPGRTPQTLATVQASFQQVFGNNPFSYGFVDQDLDHLYTAETRMGTLFNVFSVLSVAISCLGLFGLATFATQRRRKEIGVRKVLGAGETGIVALLAKEFLQLVAIALLIAFPVAWYVMNQWLQGFVYKVNISAWVFVGAGVAAILVAFATVSFQTIKAAMANPVRSLRSE